MALTYGAANRFRSPREQPSALGLEEKPHPGGPFAWSKREGPLTCDWCVRWHTEQAEEGPRHLFHPSTLVKITKAAAKSRNKKKTRCQEDASVDTTCSLVGCLVLPWQGTRWETVTLPASVGSWVKPPDTALQEEEHRRESSRFPSGGNVNPDLREPPRSLNFIFLFTLAFDDNNPRFPLYKDYRFIVLLMIYKLWLYLTQKSSTSGWESTVRT